MSVASKALRSVPWICVGIGALLVVVTLLAVVIETRRALSGKSADATVVRYEAITGSKGDAKAVIRFCTESGDVVEVKYPSPLKFDRPSIGEPLAIVYDPSKPARVVAKEFSFRARTYGVLLVFAAIWLIPSISSLKRQRQQRAATRAEEVRKS